MVLDDGAGAEIRGRVPRRGVFRVDDGDVEILARARPGFVPDGDPVGVVAYLALQRGEVDEPCVRVKIEAPYRCCEIQCGVAADIVA